MAKKGEHRHRALLEAALDAFSRRGYEGATTRSIAEATGATEAVLFQHFPTKRALFLAVIAEFSPRALCEEWLPGMRDLPAPESLRSLATRYLDTCWEHRQWLQVLHRAAAEDDDAAAVLRRQNQSLGQPLLELLRLWADRGEIGNALVEPMRNIIWLSARGFLDWVGKTPPARWEVVRDRFVDSLLAVCFGVSCQADSGRGCPEPAGGSQDE
jgi:AcrR family transcriptional regulator